MSEEEVVRITIDEGIAVITLNRPQVLNAISRALARETVAALGHLDASPEVEAIVLTGAGDRAFCAGIDLREAQAVSVGDIEAWFGGTCAIYRSILLTDKPVVAALNGIAAGGGFQMALVADMRIGTSGTRMGQPEINAGIPSIMGAYWMSLHLGLARNQELSYTGRLMDAQECRALGLVNDLVPPEALLGRAREAAAMLASKPRVAFLRTKQRFREVALAGFEEAFRAGVLGQQAAYAAGEPQRIMEAFIAERAKRK